MLKRLVAITLGVFTLVSVFVAPAHAQPARPSGAAADGEATTISVPVSPLHVINCVITAYQPVEKPLGIEAGGDIKCTDVLDYRYLKAILWRCIVNTSNCVNHGEIAYTDRFPVHKTLTALFPCRSGTYRFHTQFFWEGFHGNWMGGQKDSASIHINC